MSYKISLLIPLINVNFNMIRKESNNKLLPVNNQIHQKKKKAYHHIKNVYQFKCTPKYRSRSWTIHTFANKKQLD